MRGLLGGQGDDERYGIDGVGARRSIEASLGQGTMRAMAFDDDVNRRRRLTLDADTQRNRRIIDDLRAPIGNGVA